MTKKKLVFLTGSGFSQPSGLNTFRTQNGYWNNHKVNDIATPAGFAKNPALVHAFYNELRAQINLVSPNIAHTTLATLQQDYDVKIITQNVDNLHERAGSEQVIHLHGIYNEFLCKHCKTTFVHNTAWNHDKDPCPSCGEQGKVRPKIVFFEEMLDPVLFYEAEDWVRNADLFIQAGTSAEVAPANTLIKRAKRRKRVEMNLVRCQPRRPFLFHNYYIGNITNSISDFVHDIPELIQLHEKGIFKKY